tara:strand:+ start:2002 stop:2277 length:276 start_codon:yes stop_codon:yes gene_type:complete
LHYLSVKELDCVHARANWYLGKVAVLKDASVNDLHKEPVLDTLLARLTVPVQRATNPLHKAVRHVMFHSIKRAAGQNPAASTAVSLFYSPG